MAQKLRRTTVTSALAQLLIFSCLLAGALVVLKPAWVQDGCGAATGAEAGDLDAHATVATKAAPQAPSIPCLGIVLATDPFLFTLRYLCVLLSCMKALCDRHS